MAKARVHLRSLPGVIWRDDDAAAVGRVAIGAAPNGSVVISLEHDDGGRLSTLMSIETMDMLAGWMAELLEAELADRAARPTGATLQ